MKVILALLLVFIHSYCFAQQQELKGYIEDQSSVLPLHGAHIQNITSQQLAISAPNGTFSLLVSEGDSIIISYTGYQFHAFKVEAHHIAERQFISLMPDQVILKDVVVTPFPEYWRFKELILETQPVDSSVHINLPKVDKYAFYDPRTASLDGDLGAPTVSIPFDLEKFTKKGKEKKKLKEILERERKWKSAQSRFNRDWVAKLSGLTGDELTDFIAFCNFTADHIIETSLTDLKNQVLVLLEEFRSGLDSSDGMKNPGA